MKKTKFLFSLLMAIVMIAMSPIQSWAQDDNPPMEEPVVEPEPEPEPNPCDMGYHPGYYYMPEGNGNHSIICSSCETTQGSSECTYGSDGVCTLCNYDSGNAVPTFNSIDALLAANLASGTVVTVTVNGTIADAMYGDDQCIYQVILENGFALVSLGVTSNPGWAAGRTVSGTLENVTFMRVDEGDEEIVGVMSEDRNIFAPEAGLEYTAPEEGSESSDGDVAIVTIEASYQNIQEALAAAKAAPSAALTITEDITLEEDEELIFDAGCITLDLNGYTITGDNENGVINVTGGSLTITDGTYEKNGKIVNNWNNAIKAIAGSLTIYAGTFIGEEGCGLFAVSENEGDLTAYISGGRFVTNDWSAVYTYNFSALAPGYGYYNTDTGAELEDINYDNIMDETGETPAKDITVRGIPVVKGELVAGNNEINISEITGTTIEDPASYNIYSFTAPATGTIIVTSTGNEDTRGALFDANFNYLTGDDDEGEDGNFSFEYEVTEGSVYYIGVREYDGMEIGDYNIKISVSTNLSEMTFVDGTAYDSAGGLVSSFTYQRTFGGTNWTTWYVPFDLELTADICDKLAFSRINNVHQYDDDEDGNADRTVIESFRQKAGVTLKANYPYLVKALDESALNFSLTLDNVVLASAHENSIDCQSVDYTYTFTGTYTGMGESGLSSYSLFDDEEDNSWLHFHSLEPQRHYMTIASRNGGNDDVVEVKLMVIGDEDADGIVTLYTKEQLNSATDDLMGRKINSNSKQPGLRIVNGKKVLFK